MGRGESKNNGHWKEEREMSYSIELHPEAFKELQASYNWYEERSEGLGDRFMALVNKRLNEIAANPDRYAKHKGNYRETKVSTFPYVIVYEVLKKKQIIFISYIFHTKRSPKLKYRR